jgi:Subtilisin inhibitor-like
VKWHAASLVALFAVLAGCGGYEGGKTPGTQTVLTISAWPNGKDAGGKREWKLYCERSGGTLPNPERACQRLETFSDPFAPTESGAMCTQEYGGPALAEIEGLYHGETVDARFTRTDGCEISRWDSHRFLFPVKPGRPKG